MAAASPWYRPYSLLAADKYGLDRDLVEALIQQESGGRADAFRYEPLFWQRYKLITRPEYQHEEPRRWSSSYGLMQLMAVAAKEMGFEDEPEYLFIPSVNLDWGCAKLKQLFEWVETFPHATARQKLIAALAAYNGGKGGNTPLDVPPRNGRYAEAVLALATKLNGMRLAGGTVSEIPLSRS